jgi:LGFP repeat
VYVDSVIPHARVRIFANVTEPIGDQLVYVGYDANFPLTRPLSSADSLTATQEAFGLVSQPSNPPVGVGPQSKPLARPEIDARLYACGRIVIVTNLSPSTHVEVYTSQTLPVPVDAAHLIGTAECTGTSVAVATQPLPQGWHVIACQVSCPGTTHQIRSLESHPKTVGADPSPLKPPVLDKPIVGNDVVTLHGLYVGAGINITDSTAAGPPSLGGGLATAESNWTVLHPRAHPTPPEYYASQDLCTSSGPGPGVHSTNELDPPVLVSPLCPKSPTVTVRRATLNAVLALYKEGNPLPVSIAGASPGEFEIGIAPGYTPAVGDRLYLRQYIGPILSGESNHVPVGDCRNVVTQHNDNARTGAYLHEHVLTPITVGARFGRLAEREVDGSPFAQMLYVRSVETPIGVKNIAIVATSTNVVYAFDADDHSPDAHAGVAWKAGPLGPTRSLTEAEICRETHGPVGITSTPVIDTGTQTIYVVARHWNSTTPSPPGQADLSGDHYLHALKLTDGTPRYRPRKVQGTDPRTGETFDPAVQRNRPGLLLLNGIVYLGFGTFNCDQGDYRGWVFGYTEDGLRPAAIFCTTAGEPHASGIWQSGNGLVGADEGALYFETGNDIGDDALAPLGDAFVRLEVTSSWPGLRLAGHFQPSNAQVLKAGDTDLGSGGPMLLRRGRLIGGGKQGRLYTMDSGSMKLTQDTSSPDPAVVGQGFQAFLNQYNFPWPNLPHYPDLAAATADHYRNYARHELLGPNIHAGPCYWPGPGLIYHMPEKDDLKAFHYDELSGHVQTTPSLTASGSHQRPPDGMPGGHGSLSANCDADGIVWMSLPTSDGQWAPAHGVLAGFDATTLKQIWSDEQSEWFAKFNPPTIADGKVFRAVFAQYALAPGHQIGSPRSPTDDHSAPRELRPGRIIIYGLLPPRNTPRPMRQWRTWIGGGDPARRWSLAEKRDRHHGSGALVMPTGSQESLSDGGQRQDFTGWIVTPRDVASVRARDTEEGSCQYPPHATIAVTSSIFWSEATGAHIVLGEIRDEYLRHDGPFGPLGYPTSDERPDNDYPNRIGHFQHGVIAWSPITGPQVTLG